MTWSECAAARAGRCGAVSSTGSSCPTSPLDVLAQQIVAMCAAEDWDEDDALRYHSARVPLSRICRWPSSTRLLDMLSEGIAAKRGRYAAYLHRDRVNGRAPRPAGRTTDGHHERRRDSRDWPLQVVAEPEGTVVGTVDEDFAVESMAGDVMLLGNTSWRIRRVSIAGRVLVEDAHGAAPTDPLLAWRSAGRTRELSDAVTEFARRIDALTAGARPGSTQPAATMPRRSRVVAHGPVRTRLGPAPNRLSSTSITGRAVLGAVPTQHTRHRRAIL